MKWDIYLGHDFFSENHVDEMVLTYIYISFNKAPFSAMSVEKKYHPPKEHGPMDPANKQGFEDFTHVNHLQISEKKHGNH